MKGAFTCPHCMTQNACNCKACKPFIKEGETVNKWDETGSYHICGKCGKSYSPYQSLDAEYKLNKMTDKLYNGFNNGRDKSDGVGGRELNHGTQQTMTKEQTAVEWIADRFRQYQKEGYRSNWDEVIQTVLLAKEIEDKALSKEREKAKKIEHALKMCVDALKGLDATDYVAYTAGKVALIEYSNH